MSSTLSRMPSQSTARPLMFLVRASLACRAAGEPAGHQQRNTRSRCTLRGLRACWELSTYADLPVTCCQCLAAATREHKPQPQSPPEQSAGWARAMARRPVGAPLCAASTA